MELLIKGILYLILAFSPYLVYWCMKTKERAMISIAIILIVIDLMVLHFYFNLSLF